MYTVEVAFQSIDVGGPKPAKLRQPSFDFFERLGLQAIKAALRVHRGFDEASLA
jgi:hypothetical protein